MCQTQLPFHARQVPSQVGPQLPNASCPSGSSCPLARLQSLWHLAADLAFPPSCSGSPAPGKPPFESNGSWECLSYFWQVAEFSEKELAVLARGCRSGHRYLCTLLSRVFPSVYRKS